jgi:hypothetical protein
MDDRFPLQVELDRSGSPDGLEGTYGVRGGFIVEASDLLEKHVAAFPADLAAPVPG